jgi:hypothetical protein
MSSEHPQITPQQLQQTATPQVVYVKDPNAGNPSNLVNAIGAILTGVLTAAVIGLVALYAEHRVVVSQVEELRTANQDTTLRVRAIENSLVSIEQNLTAQNRLLQAIADEVGVLHRVDEK